MYEIYVITNSVTGLKYVGLTKRTAVKRLSVHLSEARRNVYGMYLHNSMRIHPSESFSVEVIDNAATYDEACAKEIEWIERLNTIQPNGYNEHIGGQGGCREASPELRQKLSAAKKGRPPPNKGKPMSEEQKAKISAAKKGKKQSPEHVANRLASYNRGRD